jgi:hypothetical protein
VLLVTPWVSTVLQQILQHVDQAEHMNRRCILRAGRDLGTSPNDARA